MEKIKTYLLPIASLCFCLYPLGPSTLSSSPICSCWGGRARTIILFRTGRMVVFDYFSLLLVKMLIHFSPPPFSLRMKTAPSTPHISPLQTLHSDWLKEVNSYTCCFLGAWTSRAGWKNIFLKHLPIRIRSKQARLCRPPSVR